MSTAELFLSNIQPYKTAEAQEPALSLVRPNWIPSLNEKMRQLLALKPGWDGAEAIKISDQVVEYALRLLDGICSYSTRPPQAIPTSTGGIQIEWHANGVDIEIEIDKPFNAQLYIEYVESGDIIERKLEWYDPDLARAIQIASE